MYSQIQMMFGPKAQFSKWIFYVGLMMIVRVKCKVIFSEHLFEEDQLACLHPDLPGVVGDEPGRQPGHGVLEPGPHRPGQRHPHLLSVCGGGGHGHQAGLCCHGECQT